MIDATMFNVQELVRLMLGSDWKCDDWRKHATIVPAYMPPYPHPREKPRCVVKFGGVFLRHSKGPRQGHSWDMYGDDYITPELALLALCEAPPPPQFCVAGVAATLEEKR
jgi:hypothetical protein